MNFILVASCLCLLLHRVVGPPPRRTDNEEKKEPDTKETDELEDFGLEYNRYLKEVVELLESDSEFKKKLEDAQEADIRSGKIAKELEFVDHKVRTKLDEVKRQELERLRHLAQKQYELSNGIDTEHVKISSEHLDHENPHTFEMEDLKKLIAKVSSDLNEADEKRRQEFKEYEMQKEFEKQERLKHLDGSEKEAFEKQIKENETKHKQHEPLHHPGSKQQLEEVWEKQDHMENQDFDPKVFFKLHDLDGNGAWDHNEVKTLFLKELDKMYQAGAPEDDMRERVEEMERMREHVFGEADKNRDGLISYDEFLEKTKQPDFERDSGWESLDQKPFYTMDEYKEFERRRQEEVQRMIQQGLIPPQPIYQQHPGYHHQAPYSHPQQGYHPQEYGQGHQFGQGYHNQIPPAHPNQVPLGHPNQLPQGHPNQAPIVHPNSQGQHNQVPINHPNQIPQGQQNQVPPSHPNQLPQGYPNQIPQGHPNQISQGHPNQIPQAHPDQIPQGHPNQIPQAHPNQIPQGLPNQLPQGHPDQLYSNQLPVQGNANQVPQIHPNQMNQGNSKEIYHHQAQQPQGSIDARQPVSGVHPNLNAQSNELHKVHGDIHQKVDNSNEFKQPGRPH